MSRPTRTTPATLAPAMLAGPALIAIAFTPGLAALTTGRHEHYVPGDVIAIALAATLLLAWLAWAWRLLLLNRVKAGVMASLAGIALFDAWVLALFGFWPIAILALACFAITVAMHRRIAGT